MNQAETKRFEELYQRHLTLLKLQGKSQKTIDTYSRAIRRTRDHFGCCPNKITPKQPSVSMKVRHRPLDKLV